MYPAYYWDTRTRVPGRPSIPLWPDDAIPPLSLAVLAR